MQALSQLSYGPTSLRSEIIALPQRVGKHLLHFSSRALRGGGDDRTDSVGAVGQRRQDRALIQGAVAGAGVDQLRERAVHALQFSHALRDVL